MIELGLCAVLLVASVIMLMAIYQEEPEFDETCAEKDCFRPATHQRPEAVSPYGTPIVVLVCRRHGRIPR